MHYTEIKTKRQKNKKQKTKTKTKKNINSVKINAPIFDLVGPGRGPETLTFDPHTPFHLPMSYRPPHSEHQQKPHLLLSSLAEPPPLAYKAD